MFKKILAFILAFTILSLCSCKVVEVIDHGTTLPEEETTPEGTTGPQKEYSPWGFWYAYENLSVIELTEGATTAKVYSTTPGYYEYDDVITVDCFYDGNATFTLSFEEGDTTESLNFVFDKFANTLTLTENGYTTKHLPAEKAPTKHATYPFPNYADMDLASILTVGELDFASFSATVLEGVAYEIATDFWGAMEYFPMLENPTRPTVSGDVVNIDYCGKLDGVAFTGGTATDVTLFVSDYDNKYIPGFTDGIIGHTVGETFDVPVTFPEEYHSADLAGKAVVFTMTLHGICNLSLTDEQVQALTDKAYSTYADLFEFEKEAAVENFLRTAILEATAVVKTPEEAYLYFYQQIADYYHMLAYYYGVDYETLAYYYGLSDAYYMNEALNEANYNMALFVLAQNKGIVWGEKEFEAKYEEYVADYLETYQNASREEACNYADKFVIKMELEITKETVLAWAMQQIFPATQE